ncbi:MAG: tetratricopeptide repeat-containing diguanylate cyclase [Candidatus Limnocylindrales bacterium]|jgi:diguanylate cyclase (GGDEF)-like protein
MSGPHADTPKVSGKAGNDARARLSDLLDDLEFHRAFDVDARLERAVRVEKQAAAAGATDLQMRARLVQADMRLRTGQAAAAAHLATEVNHWAREQGPSPLLARSHLVLSSLFESIGDSASCLDHALRALELLDDSTPPRTRGNFLIRLGDALAVAGSFDEARERYREAEQVFLAVGDVERQISVLNNLAYAEYEAGDPQRAWDVAQEMRSLAAASDYDLTPPLLDTLARAHIGMGEYEQAALALEAALQTLSTLGNVEADTPAGILLTLAEVQLRQGRLEAAQGTLERCRTICVERNLGAVEVEVLRVQADLHAAAGRFGQAYEMHKLFHSEFLKLNSIRREANARTRQALFETAEARHEAQRFWRQARTDALTGLPNRRFVDEEIPRRLNEVVTGTPLVVAIVDADRFKRINDTLSHEVGDRAICELGRVLVEALPAGPDPAAADSRFVARLGGEEFLVVLPGLDLAAATPVLKALRYAVARHEWSPLIGKLALTVSVGASAAVPRDSQSTLLARADHSLYAAKSAGRNRVVVEQRSMGGPLAASSLAAGPTIGRRLAPP